MFFILSRRFFSASLWFTLRTSGTGAGAEAGAATGAFLAVPAAFLVDFDRVVTSEAGADVGPGAGVTVGFGPTFLLVLEAGASRVEIGASGKDTVLNPPVFS
jgi:hypothetical protein